MLKKLIWKQYYESFRGYFVDSKTGKKKSKAKTISTFVLIGSLLLFLSICFFGMAFTLEPLLDSEIRWLYYFLFVVMSITIGLFSGAFSANHTIYQPRDNDLLLSMPIKPSLIMLSRISLVFGLSFITVLLVWLPGCLYPFINNGFNFKLCIIDLLLLFVITLFTSVIACIIGYLIALVSKKTKNRSYITVIISLLFFGAYYFFTMRLSNIMDLIVANGDLIAKRVSVWGNILLLIAKGANGDILSFVLSTVIVILLSYLCYVILQRSFKKIVTQSNNVSTKKTKVVYKSNNSVSSVLLKKEFKRFTSSATYMLNCGLGVVMVLLVAVLIVIKRDDLYLIISLLKSEMPELYSFVPLIIVGIVCTIISLNAVAVPSVSLEGKNLWIIKSLPIKEADVLNAKKTTQLLINAIPSLISIVVICLALEINFSETIYMLVVTLLFVEIHSSICILLSLINPNFNWVSEVQPIKQNMNILLEMVISWIIVIVFAGAYYFFMNSIGVDEYLQYLVMAMVIVEVLLRRITRSWGIKKLKAL